MIAKIEPKIYPFLSETETYAAFASVGRFASMEKIMLLDENHSFVKELNSDDFVLSKGFKGTDKNTEGSHSYTMYFKTDTITYIAYYYYYAPENAKNEHLLSLIPETIEMRLEKRAEHEKRCREIEKKREERIRQVREKCIEQMERESKS